MKYKLSEILKLFKNPEVTGSEDIEITAIASLEKAKEGELSFLGNKKYSPEVPKSKASVILLPRSYTGETPAQAVIVKLDNPSVELAKICMLIEKELYPKPEATIHPSATIHHSAKIGEGVYIGPNVVISEDVYIGDRVILRANNFIGKGAKIEEDAYLMPNAVIMDYCEIGKRCRIQSGAVIGSDGYGYEFVNGVHERVPQVGKVVLEDDVDIGANTCIDRARFDKTLIGAGTKVDNLVQIAHNVQVGKGALIVSQVGISGSTKLGNYCVLGGQVGVAGHLNIGDGAMIGGQSGINGDVPAKAYMRGSPARPYMQAHKIDALLGHLPDLFSRVKDVEKKLGIEKKVFEKKEK